MGAKKKYTAKALEKAVENYFRSISREKAVTEDVWNGDRDSMGHKVYDQKPVLNALGEPMTRIEYLIPPTVGGLAAYLGIHRSTWNAWCDSSVHPEYRDITEDAMGRIHSYLETESLTRPGKDLKGVIFNLENNYGYREKTSVHVTGGLEDYLNALSEQDGGGSQF